MKTIPAGRYLVGFDLSGEVTSNMVLVPMGPRNIPNWQKAFAMGEDEFNEFLHQRAVRRRELAQRVAEAKESRGDKK